MKKNTIEMMYAYLNGQTVDVDALREEVNVEYEKATAKSRANAELYDAAKPIVLAALTYPMTARALYEAIADDLPEEMTANKIQYGLLHYWMDDVEKQDNGKNPYTYVRK